MKPFKEHFQMLKFHVFSPEIMSRTRRFKKGKSLQSKQREKAKFLAHSKSYICALHTPPFCTYFSLSISVTTRFSLYLR